MKEPNISRACAGNPAAWQQLVVYAYSRHRSTPSAASSVTTTALRKCHSPAGSVSMACLICPMGEECWSGQRTQCIHKIQWSREILDCRRCSSLFPLVSRSLEHPVFDLCPAQRYMRSPDTSHIIAKKWNQMLNCRLEWNSNVNLYKNSVFNKNSTLKL